MNSALTTAHRTVSEYMGTPALGDFPINLCHVDEEREALVVGIPDLTAAAHYRHFLRQHIGAVPLNLLRCAPATRHFKKKSHNRPLIGGLQVSTPSDGLRHEVGTICIVAKLGAQDGFVTAGHVAGNVGDSLYQPEDKQAWLAGTVEVVSAYQANAPSDSAFLAGRTDLSRHKIWKGDTTQYTVTGTVGGLAPGAELFMQGAALVKERTGQLALTNVTVNFGDTGVLTDQWLATYDSRSGDSGAPVYVKVGDANVRLAGLNVGATELQYVNPKPDGHQYPPENGEYAIISPWANLVADLGNLTL
jgi:hypothetical protein